MVVTRLWRCVLSWWLPLLVAAMPLRIGLSLSEMLAPPDPTGPLEFAQQAGVRLVRLRADWARIQPTATTWDFAALDAVVAQAKAHKLDVVLVCGPAPAWAVTYLGNPTPDELPRACPDITAYRAFLTALVRRYSPEVRYYQVWHRPSPDVLLAMMDDVHALFRAATDAIHRADPRAQVIVPEAGDLDLCWISRYLSTAIGTERPDIVVLCPTRVALQPNDFFWRIQVLRRRVLTADAPQLWADLPLCAPSSVRWTPAVAAMLDDIATLLFHGERNTTDWLADPTLPNELRALGTAQDMEFDGVFYPATGVRAGQFHHATSTAALLAPEHDCEVALTPSSLPVPSGLAVPDAAIRLIPLHGAPHGVTVAAPSSLSLPAQPLWVTDVLATPHEREVTWTPPAVTADCVTLDPYAYLPDAIHPLPNLPGGRYWESYRGKRKVLCTIRDDAPWIHLDIPDGFLFFNTARVPVEVAVSVCGVTTPRKTGFTLYYGTPTGMKNTPWQWIDTDPHRVYTYTLRLDDALFAGQDGYDLRLNMGGSRESVELMELTVRKLAQ